MSEACGEILTHNGDSCRVSSRGPGWCSSAELKERLFTDKSNRPGDDTKEALRTDGNTAAWQAWYAAQNLIPQSCQPAPPIGVSRREIFRAMYAQIGEEEQVFSLHIPALAGCIYEGTKRKQGEDNALIGWSPCCMCRRVCLLVE